MMIASQVAAPGSAYAETGGYPHADAAAHNAAVYEWWVDENGDGLKQITASETDNDETVSGRGYFYRNCTDYVAWKLESLGVSSGLTRGRGNGGQWDDSTAGVTVNATPAYGAAAVNPTAAAGYGHVSFVEEVYTNGTIKISEYNYGTSGGYGTRTGTPAALGIASFVHFGVTGGVSVASGPDDPKGAYDEIKQVLGGAQIRGWTFDPNTNDPIAIHVYEGNCCANPRGAFTANVSRPDVGVAYPGKGDNHGFETTMSLPAGIAGDKTYCVYAINTGTGSNTGLGCKTVTFNWNPFGHYENIRRAPGGVHLSGWTVDMDTANPLAVHVYEGQCCANPRGAFMADSLRPDVASAHPGHGSPHGFEVNLAVAPSSPTTKSYCVYAINSGYGSSSPELACKSVMVDPDVAGNFESAETVTGGVQIVGWAIDPDSAATTQVHVYDGSTIVGIITANTSRPDVGVAWPDYGSNHGFAATIPLTPGQHTLCAYGINVSGTSGSNKILANGCRTVTVS